MPIDDFNAGAASRFNAGHESPRGWRGKRDGWTIRFWLFQSTFATQENFVLSRFNTFAQRQWTMTEGDGTALPAGPPRFEITAGDGVESPLGIQFGQWDRAIFGYDALRDETFIQVNQAARAVTGDVAPMIRKANTLFYVSPPPIRVAAEPLFGIIDELAIWQGYTWDEEDSEYDWNEGNGRTYPDVPAPEHLLAYWPMESFSSTSPNVVTDIISGIALTSILQPGGLGYAGEIVTGKVGNGLKVTRTLGFPLSTQRWGFESLDERLDLGTVDP